MDATFQRAMGKRPPKQRSVSVTVIAPHRPRGLAREASVIISALGLWVVVMLR